MLSRFLKTSIYAFAIAPVLAFSAPQYTWESQGSSYTGQIDLGSSSTDGLSGSLTPSYGAINAQSAVQPPVVVVSSATSGGGASSSSCNISDNRAVFTCGIGGANGGGPDNHRLCGLGGYGGQSATPTAYSYTAGGGLLGGQSGAIMEVSIGNGWGYHYKQSNPGINLTGVGDSIIPGTGGNSHSYYNRGVGGAGGIHVNGVQSPYLGGLIAPNGTGFGAGGGTTMAQLLSMDLMALLS